MRFREKVLFATGAGSGIAAAVAQRFTEEGGLVAVADLNGENARMVADKLGGLPLEVDVADEASVVDAVRTAHEHFGRIDCAFPAAGFADFGPISEWSLERWNRMLGVHLGGTFLVCREVAPLMRAQGAGSIVNVASIAAITAQSTNHAYGAAKGAIAAFSRQLALDLAPEIRVNVLAPGRIRTPMTRPVHVMRGDGDYERGAKLAAEATVLKRLGEPEEMAATVCFLLSEDAGFITGAVIVADGGETIV